VEPDPPDLLAPVGDVDALARAIGRLEDDDLVDEASRRSRARFEAAFTSGGNLPMLEAIYHSVR
jgi:glycosyltransferase involved in cell wall biosynthesis